MKIRENKKNLFFVCFVFSFFLLLISCGKTPIPRPYGYFRVDLPTHHYEKFDSVSLPYSFDKPAMAYVRARSQEGENFWIDVIYPTLNASIYCSYKPVKGNLYDLLEDTRKIAYKHTVRADNINDQIFVNRPKKVYGIFYDLEGNTASQAQFILTDSVKHFFRAALYFENVPNKDSIAPMAEYVKLDMKRMMESFEWKK
jgi:gliding motility-associated lipoprotein GldD